MWEVEAHVHSVSTDSREAAVWGGGGGGDHLPLMKFKEFLISRPNRLYQIHHRKALVLWVCFDPDWYHWHSAVWCLLLALCVCFYFRICLIGQTQTFCGFCVFWFGISRTDSVLSDCLWPLHCFHFIISTCTELELKKVLHDISWLRYPDEIS